MAGSNGDPIGSTVLFSVPGSYRSDEPYPLVVALHGYGENAASFHDLWKAAADSLGFVLLTPQGEECLVDRLSYGWGENSERIVLASMDLVRKHVFIRPDKIFLTGFSQGGIIAYAVGFRHPGIFDAIAPLGAPFDSTLLPKNIGTIAGMRVYIGQGNQDKNFQNVRAAAELLTRAGLKVHFQIYKGVGHGLPEPRRDELTRILQFFNSSGTGRNGGEP